MMNPGLIVAPLTPFTADLKVDEPALRRQIDYVVERLRRHHGGRRRRRDPGIHLSQPRTAQGPDPAHDRVRRRPRAGHGRHLAPVVQDRDRAGAPGARARRGGGAAAGAAAAVRRAADAGRSHRLFRGDRARDRAADHALSQSRPRRRRVHSRHHRARQASRRAAHQGKLARSRAGVAADRRDRSRRSRPLFHHHADAAGDAAARRLRRDHAAAGIGDRAARHRRLHGQGLRARGRAAASVRAVPVEVDASRPRPGR